MPTPVESARVQCLRALMPIPVESARAQCLRGSRDVHSERLSGVIMDVLAIPKILPIVRGDEVAFACHVCLSR
jgi:hypothetical protein